MLPRDQYDSRAARAFIFCAYLVALLPAANGRSRFNPRSELNESLHQESSLPMASRSAHRQLSAGDRSAAGGLNRDGMGVARVGDSPRKAPDAHNALQRGTRILGLQLIPLPVTAPSPSSKQQCSSSHSSSSPAPPFTACYPSFSSARQLASSPATTARGA